MFTKIWDTPDSGYAERMKHVIEPTFAVDYTTPIANYERTPLLTDASDFVVGGATRLTYGLDNRLFYRGKTADGVRGPDARVRDRRRAADLLLEFRVEPVRHGVLELEREPQAGRPVADRPDRPRRRPRAALDANTRVEYDVSRRRAAACCDRRQHGRRRAAASGSLQLQPAASDAAVDAEQLPHRGSTSLQLAERPGHAAPTR